MTEKRVMQREMGKERVKESDEWMETQVNRVGKEGWETEEEGE